MKIYVYPADRFGCGHHRLIWVSEILRQRGYDITISHPSTSGLFGGEFSGHFATEVDLAGDVVSTTSPPGADVVVFQRVCHRVVVGIIERLREMGVAVVVDVDDDLGRIHPRNSAFASLHPRNERPGNPISWRYLHAACNAATLVTASTPILLDRYAQHGRGRVLPNYLADHYYGVGRVDSADLGWAGVMWSHPNDPQVVGPAVARLVREGARFSIVGNPVEAGTAFALEDDPPGTGIVELMDWPREVAKIGIGLAPLADTAFNAAKSWLKPLEQSALGVPWVGSPRVEYIRLHRLGCGLLAARPKDWYRQLKRLRDDGVLRRELSEAGREVAATLRLRDHAEEWVEAWLDALSIQRGVHAAVAR